MKTQIAKILSSETGKIYQKILDAVGEYTAPHEFVDAAYSFYLRHYPKKGASTNGLIFEYIICETLARESIVPFYFQAKFERVPNADFDVVLYNEKAPIVLTMKVSLRERYKQADLEGLALRQVYRRAQSHLITLSAKEAVGVATKIKSGDIAGLDTCILANQPEYTELLAELAKQEFSEARHVMPITGKAFPV